MSSHSLLSRVAESVYWMGRYIERAENVARFIDVNVNLSLDSPPGLAQQWAPLIQASGDEQPFTKRYGEATRDSVIQYLTFDLENPNSILSCLRTARENARTVRDTISSEMWEQVNRMYLELNDEASRGRAMASPQDVFFEFKLGCHLFEGIADSTMSRGEAWHFMKLGRSLERADKATRILDVKYFYLLPSVSSVGTSIDDIQWAAVLKSVSGLEMYRKACGPLVPAKIVEFLLLDCFFPRAVHYSLTVAAESLHAITGTRAGSYRNHAERLVGQLRSELDYTSMKEVIANGLHEFLDGLQVKINRIDDAIYDEFFTMRPVPAANARGLAGGAAR